MRKALFFLSFLLFCFSSLTDVCAQKTPEQMGGVYYAYPVDDVSGMMNDELAKAGTPFYISHYGRHGSRWLTSEDRYIWVNKQFDDKSNLTPLGKNVRRRLKKIWKNAQGNAGQLTPLGARQHRQIARRMMVNFPEVFQGDDVVITAHSSTAQRCKNSMLQFVEQMKIEKPSLRIPTTTRDEDMQWIAFSSQEQKRLEQNTRIPLKVSPGRLVQSLFKDPSRVENPTKLLTELHTIASDMQDIPLKVSLYDIFTEEELRAVYEQNNERMTICNGDYVLNEGIPARSAISLWRRIEADADAMISSGRKGADLRFGHDTNLYRLLTLMGVDTKGKGMDEIIPMAANLQMVFCRNAENDVVVQLLHNERLIGRYHWKELKNIVDERIHQFEHLRQLCALNTMVGTDQANTTSVGLFGKGSEEHGQTLPAVLVPNGQNFWTPQTRDSEQKCIAPFYYRDSLFQGFRNSHWIVGGCTQDYGSFTVAALSGNLRTSPSQRATPFNHHNEISHPHYYAVTLPQERLRAELTATSHTAMMRLTPFSHEGEPAETTASRQETSALIHIVLQPNSDEGQGFVAIDTLTRTIYGFNPVHRIYQGWGESAGFSGHFVLKYTDEIVDFGTFEGEKTFPRHTSIRQHPSPSDLISTHHPELATPAGVYLTFRCPIGKPLLLTMSSSFTNREGALLNLKEETRNGSISFDEMGQNLAYSWISRLHTIDVEDADTARIDQFYGALYRASFLPHELSDVDGSRPRFANEPSDHPSVAFSSAQPSYTDFSAWDTYRALHPLYNIILPTLSGTMMQSLVNMYDEGGWLPIFPCWNSYTAAMIGDHCSAILADAYVKGVRNFDAQKAYEAMRKNAFESPANIAEYKNGMGRRALSSYLKYGYIPLEDLVSDAFHTEEQTSRTLEYAFDDYAVAQMAKALGREKDEQSLMKRSENWRNVINPRTGWADGRHADGSWENNTDIIHRKPYITEGATSHYTWYVPQNIPALIDKLGGGTMFEQKLDSMFGNPLSSTHLTSPATQLYWHGNEPCHQVPFLFNYTAHPWKTQHWVRHILETEYNDSPGGLSGNDDAGQMSAWYLFAAMGFYPVCPATPVYELASPTFRRVTLNLENGRQFVIDAPNASPENIYIRKATINGRPLPSPKEFGSAFSISHDEILRGGTLLFDMTADHP